MKRNHLAFFKFFQDIYEKGKSMTKEQEQIEDLENIEKEAEIEEYFCAYENSYEIF